MRTDLRNRPTEKFAFFDNHLIPLVSRTPDAVTDVLIGPRELHNNLILARRVARSCGRPQPNRLTDFEAVRCHALAVKRQEVIPGQAESADGGIFGEASMGPVPVVAMEPFWEVCAALI